MSSERGSGPGTGITMVGSANMDLVFTVERIPRPGETLLAHSSATNPGGKGLNQAVAAARAGGTVTFVGAVGDDTDGQRLAETMAEAGIDGSLLRRAPSPTGRAFITLDPRAENTIIVDSGANAEVTSLTPDELAAVENAAVLLMQLELPLGTVMQAAEAAKASGTAVMLNAAPASPLPDGLLESLDYLIVNEHEACLIGGSDDLATASATLAGRVGRLIVTLGADGAALFDAGVEIARIPALRVTPVDTTGAGDTFCGALAAAIAEGRDLQDAARFATAAAALSVQARGAVPSIPHRRAIDDLLAAS